MTQSSHWEIDSSMKLVPLITSIMLAAAPVAFSQSDAEIVNTIQTNATRVFLEQAHWVLPESFLKGELSPSDKERLILQLANDTANCMADAAVEYAALSDVPLSDLVSSDGSIHFDGDSGKEFEQLFVPCVSRAWEAAGISRE